MATVCGGGEHDLCAELLCFHARFRPSDWRTEFFYISDVVSYCEFSRSSSSFPELDNDQDGRFWLLDG